MKLLISIVAIVAIVFLSSLLSINSKLIDVKDLTIDSLNSRIEQLDSLYKEEEVRTVEIIQVKDSIQIKYKNIYVKNANHINILTTDDQVELLSRNLSKNFEVRE